MDQGKPMFPDALCGNSDGVVAWREARMAYEEGHIDRDLKLEGHVPMVRCYHHASPDWREAEEHALNLSYGNHNVYKSDLTESGWKAAARQ